VAVSIMAAHATAIFPESLIFVPRDPVLGAETVTRGAYLTPSKDC
jgi:hypothetical protein